MGEKGCELVSPNKRIIYTSLVISILAFTSGYFYGGAAPQIIELQQDKVFSEVRDSHWNRCYLKGATGRDDNAIEEQWHCRSDDKDLFIVKKLIKTTERAGASNE